MTVRFYARAQLGLGPPILSRLAERSPYDYGIGRLGYTRHWTGSGGTLFHPDPVARLRGIYAYHVHTLGYGDIAYNGWWDADGNVGDLRDPRWVGAHAGSSGNVANRQTDGLVFLEDRRGWTQGAAAGFAWWRSLWRLLRPTPPQEWAHEWWAQGHGGLPTACPGGAVISAVHAVGGHV